MTFKKSKVLKFVPPQIAAPPNSNLKSLRDTIQGHLSLPAVTPFIIRFPSETKRLFLILKEYKNLGVYQA